MNLKAKGFCRDVRKWLREYNHLVLNEQDLPEEGCYDLDLIESQFRSVEETLTKLARVRQKIERKVEKTLCQLRKNG